MASNPNMTALSDSRGEALAKADAVLSTGIQARLKLEHSPGTLEYSKIRNELKRLLGAAEQTGPFGEGLDPSMSMMEEGSAGLGMRYALTCWLDEIFVDSPMYKPSPWSRAWNDAKIEQDLYRHNLRYEKFWEQARLAESSPHSTQMLEIFLLCAFLGFRGRMEEEPQKLKEWTESIRKRVRREYSREPSKLGDRGFVDNVPELTGKQSLDTATRLAGLASLVFVPVLTFLMVKLFGGQ